MSFHLKTRLAGQRRGNNSMTTLCLPEAESITQNEIWSRVPLHLGFFGSSQRETVKVAQILLLGVSRHAVAKSGDLVFGNGREAHGPQKSP
jgi:hypothetical protein